MNRMAIRQAKRAEDVARAQALSMPTQSMYTPPRLGDPINYPNFQAYPHCIYFYYLKKSVGAYYSVMHYYSPGTGQPLMTHAQVKTEVEKLVINAQIPNEGDRIPPPIGAKWQYPVWDQKSYIAIFIDDPNVVLAQEAIAVKIRAASNDTDNNTFFDAWHDTINSRPLICFVNHMKIDNGGIDIGFDAKYYHFEFDTNPPLLFPIAYPDSGGTNMGPPVPPP